jgi:hypothetical protein
MAPPAAGEFLMAMTRHTLPNDAAVEDIERRKPPRMEYHDFVRGRRLRQSGHGQCQAFTEEDGELGLGHGPLARRHVTWLTLTSPQSA